MRESRRGTAAALLVLGLLLAGCSGGDRAQQATPTTTAPATTAPPTTEGGSAPATTFGKPASSAQFRRARVRLVQVAELQQPVAMAVRPGERALYVAEQTGRVRALRGGKVDPTPVVDISDQVTAGGEQGLLGLAFAPDGRFLYLNFTDSAGDSRVVELAMRGGRADPGSLRLLLRIDDPFANHNGGQLAFGPDRRLYIAFGDGGGGGDPLGSGQSLGTLLGKILRIDPRPAGGRPYRVPSGNPFAGRDGARPEIWSYGLRNPWRFSFDPATGDMWIGDVGQNAWEEIDHEPAGSGGRNYGWNRREGLHAFEGDRPAGAVDPVIEYGREGGACTVIGGSVYWGRRIPGLRGVYLYGDYCAGWVRAARVHGGRVAEQRDLGLSVPSLTSFGVGPDGELYAMSLSGPVYRLSPA
ncbi:MAG TPA: PQQ-dependent sugar dehydrogenase [Actinomycetota bacterium]|nr:PQQ-dependent sugar dehydrogenase [Actinomycetota bacterium]